MDTNFVSILSLKKTKDKILVVKETEFTLKKSAS